MEDMLSTIEDREVSLRTGRALRQLRQAASLSLRELAGRSGISPSMISDIERGTKSPTIVTVIRLAQALGVSASALVDGGVGPAPLAFGPLEGAGGAGGGERDEEGERITHHGAPHLRSMKRMRSRSSRLSSVLP